MNYAENGEGKGENISEDQSRMWMANEDKKASHISDLIRHKYLLPSIKSASFKLLFI